MMRSAPAFESLRRLLRPSPWALALALALSGCAPAAPERSAEAPAAAASPLAPDADVPPRNPALAGKTGTLTVWLAADYASEPLYRDLNAQFEAAYPGVTVKLLGVPWEDMPTKVKTAIIGGKPPDVAHQHPFALGAQGFAEPLDDMWAQWGAKSLFLPGALLDCAWRDRLYGVPLDLNCTILVYNRALLKAAGVAEPGAGYTFGRWRDDLKKLTVPAAQQYGVGLATGSWHTFAFIRANGGEVLTEANGRVKATFTDPRTVEAVRFLTGLGHADHVGPAPTTKAKDYEDATTLFTMGKVAMMYTGPWDFATIRQNAPQLDFGVARFPAGTDGVTRGSVQGGGGLFVPKGAANRELAFEWMKWAVSDRYALRMAKEMGRFPVQPRHYADPVFTKDPAVATFVAALPGARPYRLDAYPQAHQAFMDAVRACFYGADPARELAKAERVAQLAIDATEGQ
jgi:ABC-type glycerol-3-phosphate transport system substrate-binding protein